MTPAELDKMFVYYRTAGGQTMRVLPDRGARAARKTQRQIERGFLIPLNYRERREIDRKIDEHARTKSC